MSDYEQVFDGVHTEFYRGANGGRGAPLLFVHGAWSGSWAFANYLTYLAAGGWNCYALNMRGHYKSPPAELAGMTQWDYARDLIRIARRLPMPPVLIGFGTGAHVIQLALSKGASVVGAVFISAKSPNIRPQADPPEDRQLPLLLPGTPITPAPDLPHTILNSVNAQIAQTVEPRSLLIALMRGEAQTTPDFVTIPYLVVNGELDTDISPAQGKELAEFYRGKGTFDLVHGVSHEGILVGLDWREGANAINSWLTTNGFHALQNVLAR